MVALRAEHWADLVGAPFELGGEDPARGIDCWGVVQLVHQRRGITVKPATQGGQIPGWQPVPEGQQQPGDVACYSVDVPFDHVGLVVDGGRILHARSGHRASVLGDRAMADRLVGYFRAKERNGATLEPGMAAGDRSSGHVVVILAENPLEPRVTGKYAAKHTGGTVQSYLPASWGPQRALYGVNGAQVDADHVLQPGDVLTLLGAPGDPGTLLVAAATGKAAAAFTIGLKVAAFFVNVALAVGASFLAQALAASAAPDVETELDSPTFNLSGIRNTTGSGATIPICFGTHRVGGHIIGSYNSISATELATGTLDPSTGPDSFETFGETDTVTGGVTTLNLLIALSEGPVQSINGITEDADNLGPLDIDEGELLINGSDAAVYADVSLSMRMGTLEQAIIPGFADTINAVAIERLLRKNEPWTYTTADEVDAFEVQCFFPRGLFRLNTSGDLRAKGVGYRFAWKPRGSNIWTEDIIVSRQYARRAAHSFVHRRDNLPRQRYTILVERLSDNDDADTSGRRLSDFTINAVNEIKSEASAHPGVALLAVKAVATDQLNGVPTLTSRVEGVRWWVWDGVSDTDPQFELQFTRNPAWQVLALLLNKTFGLGNYVSLEDIDLQSFKAWAAYCEELIDDGRGGTMARCRFDAVYDTAAKSGEWLEHMLTAGRARLVPLGKGIGVSIHQPTTPTHLFTEANVRNLRLSYLDKTARPSRVSVQFANAELEYDLDAASVESDVPNEAQYIEENISAPGVTKPARAYRMAQYRENIARLIVRSVEFEGTADAITVQPGDVFWLSSTVLTSTAVSGRLLFNTGTNVAVALDQDVLLEVGNTYGVAVQQQIDGKFVTELAQVLNPPGEVEAGDLLAVAGLTQTAEEGAVYAFGLATEALDAFEVVACPVNDELVRRVAALEYNAAIFDDDPGEVPEATDVLFDDRVVPDAVQGLLLREEVRTRKSGDVVHVLMASWESGHAFERASVFYRVEGDEDGGELLPWIYSGAGDGQEFEVGVFNPGDFIQVAVCPSAPGAATRVKPEAAQAELWVMRGKLEPPEDITGLRLYEHHDELVATWDEPGDADWDGVELRVGSSWAAGFTAAWVPRGRCRELVPAIHGQGVELTYWAKARNSSGQWSEHATGVTYTHKGSATQLVEQEESPDWLGLLTGGGIFGPNLESTEEVLTYETPAILVSAAPTYCNVTALADITVEDRAQPTWETAEFTWGDAGGRARNWLGGALLEYPDTDANAKVATWASAAASDWKSPGVAGRDWYGLQTRDLFSMELEAKYGATFADWQVAEYQPHELRSLELGYYSVRLTVRLPDASYKATVSSLRTSAVQDTTGGGEDRMRWKGRWSNLTSYLTNDVVRENEFTMVALRDTEEYPAPIPKGEPAYVGGYPDPPGFDTLTATASRVFTGQRYTYQVTAYVLEVRIYCTSTDESHSVWIVGDPEGPDPSVEQVLSDFVPAQPGWVTVRSNRVIIAEGTTFDVLLLQTAVGAPTETFGGTWDYKRTNGSPGDGEANHQNSGDEIRFAHVDDDDNDREAELITVQVGDTISAQGQVWTVTDVDNRGSHIRYGVEPPLRLANEDPYTFTFTLGKPAEVDYEVAPGWYTARPGVRGFEVTDGTAYPPAALNDNGYAVDILAQELDASEDWDFVAISGGSVSGGGGVNPDDFVPAVLGNPGGLITLDSARQYVEHPPVQGTDLLTLGLRNGEALVWLKTDPAEATSALAAVADKGNGSLVVFEANATTAGALGAALWAVLNAYAQGGLDAAHEIQNTIRVTDSNEPLAVVHDRDSGKEVVATFGGPSDPKAASWLADGSGVLTGLDLTAGDITNVARIGISGSPEFLIDMRSAANSSGLLVGQVWTGTSNASAAFAIWGHQASAFAGDLQGYALIQDVAGSSGVNARTGQPFNFFINGGSLVGGVDVAQYTATAWAFNVPITAPSVNATKVKAEAIEPVTTTLRFTIPNKLNPGDVEEVDESVGGAPFILDAGERFHVTRVCIAFHTSNAGGTDLTASAQLVTPLGVQTDVVPIAVSVTQMAANTPTYRVRKWTNMEPLASTDAHPSETALRLRIENTGPVRTKAGKPITVTVHGYFSEA